MEIVDRRDTPSRVVPLVAGAALVAGWAAASAALARSAARTRPRLVDGADDLAALGFARRSLATPTGRMTVLDAGEGPTLLFLHGIGGGASSWVWSRVAPAFVADHRVVVPEWVGWATSEHPRRRLLFDDYADQARTLLQDLPGPVTVVAQSLAAGFVLAAARDLPERVAGLVLVAPSGGMDFGEDPFGPVARSTLGRLARTAVLDQALYRVVFHRRSFLRGWLTSQGYADPRLLPDGEVDRWLASATKPGASYSALPFLSGELRYDLAPMLTDPPAPIAIVWGSEERQVGRDVGTRLAALVPRAPLIDIPATRATPELEQPGATTGAIRRALRAIEPTRSPEEVR